MRRLVSVQTKVLKGAVLKARQGFCSETVRFREHFLSGTNSAYIEGLYEMWRQDKKSVLAEWDVYFSNVEEGLSPQDAYDFVQGQISHTAVVTAPVDPAQEQINWHLKIQQLIKTYQSHGHQMAQLDPLCLDKALEDIGFIQPNLVQRLDYKNLGLTELDLSRACLDQRGNATTMGELLSSLQNSYCRNVGFEFVHINSMEERSWLTRRIESEEYWKVDQQHKKDIFRRLGECYNFTTFLKEKFSTSKRFGVEGCDSSISGLGYLIECAHKHNIENVVVGMPHRGRLETLGLIFKKDIAEIMCEFQELKVDTENLEWGNSGDVKYHLGTNYDKKFEDGATMRLSLLANPSHLEAIDPVVMGKVRASQDQQSQSILGVMVHGDAAFAGQGMVYETLQMQDLVGYKTEGTVHIITNNQIGFTTTPREARTGLYCTEVAKAISAPIFHVNADCPEEVDKCIQLAMEFRQTFKRDVVIDIIGYRKHGHNELDQPMFTQPLMYKEVNSIKPVFLKYADQLKKEGVITEQEQNEMLAELKEQFQQSYLQSKNVEFDRAEWQVHAWEQIKEVPEDMPTGISQESFQKLGKIIGTLPQEDFRVHPQIGKVYEGRQQMFSKGQGLDWGTAEALAFGSLVEQGYKVRLSGEDVERGTFSHRHAVVVDQDKAMKYCPLKQVGPEEHCVQFCNSHLSEQGVLGFEYGYSLSNPNFLVLWEAQFGDFFNGAQVIFDNFISSAESKWEQTSNITLLLPHGLDGLGPEHSSARMMRFLQMSNDDFNIDYESVSKQEQAINFQLCNPTTAANYFHLLRRQLLRNLRKPLVVFSPKKLLRLKQAGSNKEEFIGETRFKEVLDDEGQDKSRVKTVMLSQGQIYYDMVAKRDSLSKEEQERVALVRLEQISPFPYHQLQSVLEQYGGQTRVIFVQEEHQNDGPWWFIRPRVNKVMGGSGQQGQVEYCGRLPQAPTATGSNKVHALELADILNRAFGK